MIRFYSITSFRDQLAELLKIRRNIYAGVIEEIRREFRNKDIQTIRQNRDMILMEGDSVIIKLRLPDKKQRLSRKDGFRLIYLVSNERPIVSFLTIYPKNGPCQKISVTKEELKALLEQFIDETVNGDLKSYDL